jgi:hypothetical protein
MKKYLGILALPLLLASCGIESSDVGEYLETGWSPNQEEGYKTQCVGGFTKSDNSAEHVALGESFCDCNLEKIKTKWSYEEFKKIQNSKEVIAEMEACAVELGIQ